MTDTPHAMPAPRARRKHYHFPPGPEKAVPLWGVTGFRRNLLRHLEAMARAYGDVVHLKVGPYHVILVNDPELVKRILVNDYALFEKSVGLKRMKLVLGEGLLTSEGEFHRRQRQLVQPAFHREALKNYGGDMIALAVQLRDTWRDGAIVNIAQEMNRLTLAIVAKTLFSANVDDKADEVGEAITLMLEAYPKMISPLGLATLLIPTRKNIRLLRSRTKLDQIIYGMIKARRASGNLGKDLLGMLMSAHEEGIGSMTEKQVRDEAMTLFLAGHETTAVGLSWTWKLLAEHPHVRAKFDAELEQVLGGRPPEYEDLPRLGYIRKVFQEAMRLFPPAYATGRNLMQDYQLGPYFLPGKRCMVFVSPWLMQRDPRHFPDPLRFDPDRWTPEFEAGLHKFAYFPFGGGPRICIGANFAWMEATFLLAVLGQHWRMHLLPGQSITPQPLITLRPHPGIQMRLERI